MISVKRAASILNWYQHKVRVTLSPVEREWHSIWPSINSVEGHLVSPIQERWLFNAARRLPDSSVIVEIGSFKGRSTISIAFGCRGTSKHIYAVDTFNGNSNDFFERKFFNEFRQNIATRGLTPYVTPLQGWSTQVAATWNRPIQMLFIDGSHEYDDVLADFRGFFPHVVKGGLVALHDIVETWPGPLKAWHENIKTRLCKIGYCSSLAYGYKR